MSSTSPSTHAQRSPASALGRLVLLVVALATFSSTTGLASVVDERAQPKPADSEESRPNVLIIVTDDQRHDMMELMPKTQKLFGRSGTFFSRAFATTPLCCPFRASLMTGQYAHNSGVRRNEDALVMNQEHTLQRYLFEAGYTTALLGKYLNSWELHNPPPYFERFAMGSGYYNRPFNVDGTMTEISQYVPSYLGKRASGLLEKFEADDDKPWFMMVTPSTPHVPSTPHPKHRDVRFARWQGNPATFEEDLSDKPQSLYPNNTSEGVTARPKWRAYEKFGRALMAGDDLVAKIFKKLRKLNENANTLAFFMSDNGYLLGEHGLKLKRFPYPLSAQVPLYMRWPQGQLHKGAVDGRLAANIDVLPTVLDAVGLQEVPGHEPDGRSLQSPGQRDRLLLEHFADDRRAVPTWASLVTDQEQYTEYYQLDGSTLAFQEYYDLVNDPWQLTNILGDDDPLNDPDPLTIEVLSRRLEADRNCAGADCP